jgi:prepilin-type N-terminal cleavage/methylation domain-containing protein/prepilin-type processing-associated H-X9-DG protein
MEPRMSKTSPRLAFTLVELLVVISIVGALVGLLLPAIQRVRDAAARSRCSNNLRQIGIAAHQYHDTNRTLPSGVRYQDGRDPFRFSSWLAHLLPYVEQEPLWTVTQNAYHQNPSPFSNPPHVGLTTVVATYTCPADPRSATVQLANHSRFEVAFTSYLGVEGKNLKSVDGVLFHDSKISIADITDGTSQTLLAGERPPSADFQFGWWYAGAGQVYIDGDKIVVTGSADMVLGVRELNLQVGLNGFCPPGEYHFAPGRIDDQCAMFHFWSPHIGGGNFLFADGSTRFMTYAADSILPALASRDGGEVVALPD